tara:strand:+ start:317 stop:1393 length:1077 start_codon:yes stop_codon:yes gene_type:complete
MRVGIIGDGLSGLTLAKTLVNQNIYVDNLIKKKKIISYNTRTIGISQSNIEFFNKNITNIDKLICKINKIEILSENFKGQKLLNFKNKRKSLFSIVKNNNLLKFLIKDLSKNKYYKKIYYKQILSYLNKYDVIINTEYSNQLTKKYFNNFILKKYNNFAYTTIIRHEKISNNTATQIFTKKGPLAFLPISDEETSIVYSLYGSTHKDRADIQQLIHQFNYKYKIKKIEKMEIVELKSLNLKSYYYKNVLAFGDILHKIHPLAGQGFNMTIRDIKLFLEIVKRKKNLGLPLDVSANIEFEKKIKHNNLFFSQGIDLVYEFFNLERKLNSNLLGKSLQVLGRNAQINNFFTKIADRGIFM